MGRCALIWTTAGTNRVCPRCLALKDTVVGYSDELGVPLPPLHPRCRCAIKYDEVGGLAAGDRIHFDTSGKSPYLIGEVEIKEAAQVKRVLEWAESNIVLAPIENALIITAEGEIYHCTGDLNSLNSIVELGDKLKGAIVTHNHPLGSDNEYSFSNSDLKLFLEHKLARLRGVDERFVYEMNRDSLFLDSEDEILEIMEGYSAHCRNIQMARFFKYGYRRWAR